MSAQITAKEINELRQITGAGMMDCRKALTESEGDIDKAIEYLRKQGQKVAAKRSDRDANEGVALAKSSEDKKFAILLNLTSETDFVSKNEDFIAFAQSLINHAVANNIQTLEDLKNSSLDGVTVQDRLMEQVAKIGEKIDVTNFQRLEADAVIEYIHAGNKIAVIVGVNKSATDEILAVGKDIAMQIAAMNPVALNADAVSNDVIAREKDIIMDLMKQDPKMEGKPQEMLDKIAEGKLNAFFKENTLLAQPFVKDNSKTVAEYAKSAGVDVVGFKRIAIG